MNLKSYKYSDEFSQKTCSRILEIFEDLPYSDKLHFLGKITENAEYLFLSSVCNDVAHALFEKEMTFRTIPITQENEIKVDVLYDLEKTLEAIGEALHKIQAAETKKRYDSLAIPSTTISQN